MARRLVWMAGVAIIASVLLGFSSAHQVRVRSARAETEPQYTLYLPLVFQLDQAHRESGTPPDPTPIPLPDSTLPSLEEFIRHVTTGRSSVWRGLYAEEKFAARIVQQPPDQYTFISWEADVLTQYMLAQEGVVGLLAHNTHAGQYFFLLRLGDRFYLISDDGRIQRYQVRQIDRYQALQPSSSTSDYRNLETGELLTTAQIFARYYVGEPHVTLQTCIAQEGLTNWGRLFVVAQPAE